MRNPLISLSLWTMTIGSAVALACSAPDPGVNYQLTPGTGVSGSSGSAAGSSSGAPVSTATGSSSGASPISGSSSGSPSGSSGSSSGVATGSSGGGSSAEDAGAGDAGGTGTGAGGSFLGETTPWASDLPTTSALQAHKAGNQVTQTPTLDCGGCHTAGPGPAFLASGFVASSSSGTAGAADVEIRVQPSAGGTAYSAHSDSDGYFWISAPATVPAGPYNAGARNATSTQLMPAPQTSADCTSCHGGDTATMHLP